MSTTDTNEPETKVIKPEMFRGKPTVREQQRAFQDELLRRLEVIERKVDEALKQL